MRALSRSIALLLDRLRVQAPINIALARREVLGALRRGIAISPAEPIPDAVPVERVPSVARLGCNSRVLATVNADGFAFAVEPDDVPFFNRRADPQPSRQENLIDVVVLERGLCVRKRYRPPRYGVRNYRDVRLPSKEWAKRNLWVMLRGPFYAEAAALLRLRDLPFVPKLRGIDVGRRTIYIDYIPGESLRQLAAASGEPMLDVDIPRHPELRRLPTAELERREVRLLDSTGIADFRTEIVGMLREINRRGVAPLDLTLGNSAWRSDRSGPLPGPLP